jgi:nitroimidazol reductase NimA-like FMN-containing flavoprotein (pyridoxamine 5'-phosphate oxidase superfamily)
MTTGPRSSRTEVRRLPARARYERDQIDAILDEGLVAHVGFAGDDGPFVLPMAYGRDGDHLILHGSPASRLLRSLKDGVDVCVTVTLVDGLVLARSAFHHSINYRSAVVVGRADVVDDPVEKGRLLEALVEHLVPGRAEHARRPNEKELKATLVLRLAISEASAKVRTGPPLDDDDDLTMPIWAGVLPLGLRPGAPLADQHTPPGIEPPAYLTTPLRFQAPTSG